MIVDCCTRVFNTPEQLGREMAESVRRSLALRGGRLESTAEAHERATAPIAVSLVHGFRSRMLDAGIPNEFVAEVVRSERLRRLAGRRFDLSADELAVLRAPRASGRPPLAPRP